MSVHPLSHNTAIQANSLPTATNLDPSLKRAHIYCRVCEQELKITQGNLTRFWYWHFLCSEHATRLQQITEDPIPLYTKIDKMRENKGIKSLAQLYRLSGRTGKQNFLSSWKRGTAPTLDNLECIAHGLSITLSSLLARQKTVPTVAKRALPCHVCKHEGFKYKGINFCDQHKAQYLEYSKTNCKYFGNKIHQLINGLTHKEVATRFGIVPQCISKFIEGASQPAPEKLCILAAGFGKPLSYFFDVDESDTLTQTPENERYSINTSAASTITAHIPYGQQPTTRITYVSGVHDANASLMELGSYEPITPHLPVNDKNTYFPHAQPTAEYVALTNAEQIGIWEDCNMHPTDDDSSDFVPTNELNVSQDEDLFFDQDAASNFFDTLPMLEELDK